MASSNRWIVVIEVSLLLLSGCAGPDTGQSPTTITTSTSAPTTSPSQTATATPSTTESPTETSTPRGPQEGTEWTVTITRVIDGDTVEAEFPNGEIDTLRLLGVDTPETTLSKVSPEEFEVIPDTTEGRDHLFSWGERATTFANEELQGQTVRIEVDPEADRRGSFGRLLVYIYVDGENFNKQLLTNGYARVYESSFTKRAEFDEAEADARENNVGLWNFTESQTTQTTTASDGGNLIVSTIHEDADGNDQENLNDEYIEFENTGDEPIDLTGWTVQDEADHIYHFPTGFSLDPGATVTLYTGSGENTPTELYWGSGGAIWNNGGDTIIVKDDSGDTVIEREYS